MDVLVGNAGSSSLKLSLLNPADKVLADTEVEHWDSGPVPDALTSFLNDLPGADAVGHRIVHGGPRIHSRAAPAFPGVILDEPRNQAATADADISAAGAAAAALVITSREDIEIARQVRALLS